MKIVSIILLIKVTLIGVIHHNTFDVNKDLDQFGELIKLLSTRKEGFVK